MTIDKKEIYQHFKVYRYLQYRSGLFLAFTQPYVPVYNDAGKIIERNAMLHVLIILLVIIRIIPSSEMKLNRSKENKKPYHYEKINTVHMARVNFIVAITSPSAPRVRSLVRLPLRTTGPTCTTFYSALYVFIYLGIGTRLQMKIRFKFRQIKKALRSFLNEKVSETPFLCFQL